MGYFDIILSNFCLDILLAGCFYAVGKLSKGQLVGGLIIESRLCKANNHHTSC